MEQTEQQTVKKTNWKVFIPLAIVTIAVLVGAFMWYEDYIKYVSTDDAHIEGNKVSVSTKILGRIIQLYVDEGDTVKQGQLLVELDSSDILAEKEHSISLKEQAIAMKSQSVAKLNYDEENIKVLKINLAKAQDDYNRAEEQFKGQVITQEQHDHIKKAYEAAQAQYDAALKQIDVTKTQIESASKTIDVAQKQIDMVNAKLSNTKIFAPMNGIIAKRWLLPGDVVQPGQSIVTISNEDSLWVIVYIEETKLSNLHLNQKAIFNIDAFPGVTFYGHIYQIGSNTASEFSLIPPNNASGNFTKITQRVPLKVSIDNTNSKKPLKDYKILSGMSVEIKIEKE